MARNDVATEVSDNNFWSRREIAPWDYDPTGTWVWAPHADSPFEGDLVNAATGQSTKVDTGVVGGIFNATGTALFYQTDGDIKSVQTNNPTHPTTLVTSTTDTPHLLRVSPDGTKALFSDKTKFDSSQSRTLGNVRIASTASPGNPTTLDDTPVAEAGMVTFTRDSHYAFWVTMRPGGSGTLMAAPVSGGPSLMLSDKVVEWPFPAAVLSGSAFWCSKRTARALWTPRAYCRPRLSCRRRGRARCWRRIIARSRTRSNWGHRGCTLHRLRSELDA